MKIEEQFNLIAADYDKNRRKFIPCYDDFYETATKMILSGGKKPKRVLDLGAGTGLLTSFWVRENPLAEYVLADIAEEMMEISKRRFFGSDRVKHIFCDYTKFLPEGEFDAVISALSVHHLENDQKQELFSRVFERLPKGGLFVNYDQFCADSKEASLLYDCFWEEQLKNSGLTGEDISLWRERRKADRECSVAAETEMLKKSGFSDIACPYSYHKFSVIVAVK